MPVGESVEEPLEPGEFMLIGHEVLRRWGSGCDSTLSLPVPLSPSLTARSDIGGLSK